MNKLLNREVVAILLYVMSLIFTIFTFIGQLILLIELLKTGEFLKTDEFLKSDEEKSKDKNVENEWIDKMIDEYLDLSDENAPPKTMDGHS